METTTILDNVLAHRMHGESKYPGAKSKDEWTSVLRSYSAALAREIAEHPHLTTPAHLSRAAAQLAGLCIRFIEDLNLPLDPPETIEPLSM